MSLQSEIVIESVLKDVRTLRGAAEAGLRGSTVVEDVSHYEGEIEAFDAVIKLLELRL